MGMTLTVLSMIAELSNNAVLVMQEKYSGTDRKLLEWTSLVHSYTVA